jgi:hypothetical protein
MHDLITCLASLISLGLFAACLLSFQEVVDGGLIIDAHAVEQAVVQAIKNCPANH